MKILKLKKIKRRYLLKCCVYRRLAKNFVDDGFVTFSKDDIRNMYLYESQGIKFPDKDKNGYYLGKKIYDVTLSSIIEDIKDGQFIRDEFLENSVDRFLFKNKLDEVNQGNFLML